MAPEPAGWKARATGRCGRFCAVDAWLSSGFSFPPVEFIFEDEDEEDDENDAKEHSGS